MAVETLTFGCRLNAYESEVARGAAEKSGLTDVLIVNTCAVTAEAVKQARQAIRRARRDEPARAIVVTGCAAQIAPRDFADMPEVDLVLGNADKLRASSYVPMALGMPLNDKVQVNDIRAVREEAGNLIDGLDRHTRAFVHVQNGCDHSCTFCIIPQGRGSSRSVGMGAVVEQAKLLVGTGHQELVLTGVDITSYGGDLPGRPTLGTLVQAILRHVPDLPRLRISSIDAVEADGALYDAIASERRLMPHLHLSLQSGDDLILKRMKRRHSRTDALAFVEKVRAVRPDAVFGADFIAGFPTETDEMFDNTVRIVEEADLTYLHVFPFSPRPDTPAARMPQVSGSVAKARAAQLRAAGEAQYNRFCLSRIGVIESVLVERGEVGRTEQFLPVEMPGHAAGEIVSVRVTGISARGLVGESLRAAA